jgi:hypothetical protein
MVLTTRNIILALCSTLLLIQCTDVIDLDVQQDEPLLVVDAWINDLEQPQTIRLTMSQPYFENSFAPGVVGAEVIVTNELGDEFVFIDQANGDYVWTPAAGYRLGEPGRTFSLAIMYDGVTYSATSEMNRVPAIDSLVIEEREAELGLPAGIYAAVYARDFPGTGDAYWIKTYKNGAFLNKPFEINLAFDAAFDAGSGIDGLVFITPIRELINRFPDPDTDDDLDVPPWAPGDSIRVEVHAITVEAFDFMEIARDQMTNGANTIFALPLANTRSNVVNMATGESALGFFCTSAVSVEGRVIQ